jgi:hypothetical protein
MARLDTDRRDGGEYFGTSTHVGRRVAKVRPDCALGKNRPLLVNTLMHGIPEHEFGTTGDRRY